MFASRSHPTTRTLHSAGAESWGQRAKPLKRAFGFQGGQDGQLSAQRLNKARAQIAGESDEGVVRLKASRCLSICNQSHLIPLSGEFLVGGEAGPLQQPASRSTEALSSATRKRRLAVSSRAISWLASVPSLRARLWVPKQF